MLSQFRPAVVSLAVFTILLGIGYPLAMTGIAQTLFPHQANGSIVVRDGRSVGSSLIGQNFTAPGYLHPRPSAAGSGYDASASSGTNLGPTSAKLADRIGADAAALKAETGAAVLPADSVTASGSGLDPDVSPAFAALQAPRIAEARGAAVDRVRALIADNTSPRTLGLFGEPRVNVLAVNLALDALAPQPLAPAPATGEAGSPPQS